MIFSHIYPQEASKRDETIFLVLTIILALGGYFSYINETNFIKNATFIDAKIIEIQQHADNHNTSGSYLALKFKDAMDETYNVQTHSANGTIYSIGQVRQIIYQKNNPQNAKIYSIIDSYQQTLISILFSFLFFAWYLLMRVFNHKHTKKIARLKESKNIVEALVKQILSSKRKWFQIQAVWVDQGGKEHTFFSDLINFKPTDFMKNIIPVFINPNNPEDYWVNLDSLPSLQEVNAYKMQQLNQKFPQIFSK